MSPRSYVTTHVLDAASGRPAAGIPVELLAIEGTAASLLTTGITDADGRIGDLGPATLAVGTYALRFAVAEYQAAAGHEPFFPEVVVTFTVGADAPAHLHVPLLLSPYAYSTYRGS